MSLAISWLALLIATPWVQAEDRATRTLRWMEGQPGCTFSADDDGKYRYGLWTDDFGVVIAVDALELQKTRRRTEPVFTIHWTIRYRGKDSMEVSPDGATLEFVEHYHTVQRALSPDELSDRFQKDANAFAAESERVIRKHPEQTGEKQSELQAYQKNIAEMQEFIRSRSLRLAKLDGTRSEVAGWVFFSASSKWIGDWKKQEQFVLRIPLAGQVIEFPFALPPSQGDLLLRRRP